MNMTETRVDFASLAPLPGVPSAEYLEHHAVLPVDSGDGAARVLTWSETVDLQCLDDLALALRARIDLVRVPESFAPDAIAAIRRLYGSDPSTASALIEGLDGAGDEGSETIDLEHIALDDLVTMANEAPVVRLVNLFLLEAVDAGASDVHLEQYARGIRVRYRVDGVLRDVSAPPARWAPAIVSRLKIMAHLDVAERRLPQDGRIRLRLRDRDVDVRVSTLPALHGETLVLRLLDRDAGRVALRDLGMPAEVLNGFLLAISRPHGMVLVTGPTGSGKTTTLYASIDHIRTGREKILTVEDPVEYELSGVPQVPVNEKVGLTFARALRALLRQDPDVIFVGEIRDRETAEIATHAALTGHLVLSTLHTRDSIGAVARLLDLGVPGYLLASTVEAVLAQRLVRRLCPQCRGAADKLSSPCQACGDEGYVGRTGVYEFLKVDAALRQAIRSSADGDTLLRIALENGMRTLSEHGASLVAAGVTTKDEVARSIFA